MYHSMFILTYTVLTTSRVLASADTEAVIIPGNFTIGAIFPIHALTEKGSCGQTLNDQSGIQNLEAMIFSLKQANKLILGDIGKSCSHSIKP